MSLRIKVFLMFAVVLTSTVFADMPRTINYQGKLTDGGGSAITGPVNITFRLYNVVSGGTALWSETHASLAVTNGLFNVILGESTPLTLDFDDQYWIELVVGGETLTPREKLAAVSYAHRAVYADTAEFIVGGGLPSGTENQTIRRNASDWEATSDLVVTSAGNVGIGTTSPDVALDIDEDGMGIPKAAEVAAAFTIDGSCFLNVLSTDDQAGILFGDAGDPDVGKLIYDNNDNAMKFSTNTSERMRITNTGNVGIGTTAPSTDLHIYGLGLKDFALQSTNDDIDFYLRRGGGGAIARMRFQTGTTDEFLISTVSSGSALSIRSADVLDPSLYILKSNGNVGIGTTTPSAKLEVEANGAIVGVVGRYDGNCYGGLGYTSGGYRAGVYGYSSGASGNQWGVFGIGYNTGTSDVAIRGIQARAMSTTANGYLYGVTADVNATQGYRRTAISAVLHDGSYSSAAPDDAALFANADNTGGYAGYFLGGEVWIGDGGTSSRADSDGDVFVKNDLEVEGGIELGGTYRTTWPSGGDTDWIISGSDQYSGVSGNVGIGTSSPSYSLDIRSSSTASSSIVGIRNSADAAGEYAGLAIGPYGYESRIVGIRLSGTYGPTALGFYTHPDASTPLEEVMRLTDTGRVGIGTTSPTQRVAIFNDSEFTLGGNDTGVDNLYLHDHSAGAGEGNIGASISFTGPYNGGSGAQRRHAAIAGVQQTTESDYIGLAFFTHNSSVSTGDMQESMRLTHHGNLGLGTTTPDNAKIGIEHIVTSDVNRGIHMELTNNLSSSNPTFGNYTIINCTNSSNTYDQVGIYIDVDNAGSGATCGVQSSSSCATDDPLGNFGVYGYAYNGDYVYGLYGQASGGASNTYGIYARGSSPSGGNVYGGYFVGGLYPFSARSRPDDPMFLDAFGIYSSGNLATSGTKSAIVRTEEGPKAVYCQESPENWFEDFGTAKLSDGQSIVEIAADFMSSVTIDNENPMKVFVTPKADFGGRWWVETKSDRFILHAPEAPNGAEFDFRVVAKRKDFEELRMPLITSAWTDHFLYPNIDDVPKEYHEAWITMLNTEEWGDYLQYLSPEKIAYYKEHLAEKEKREIRRKQVVEEEKNKNPDV